VRLLRCLQRAAPPSRVSGRWSPPRRRRRPQRCSNAQRSARAVAGPGHWRATGRLPPATVQALALSLIAAVCIGFAVADGRPRVIVVESVVAGVFVVLAAAGVTATVWLLVAGYAGHGLKDFWQERRQHVADTRCWPVGCQYSAKVATWASPEACPTMPFSR
jgi:hypothetical protein